VIFAIAQGGVESLYSGHFPVIIDGIRLRFLSEGGRSAEEILLWLLHR
jgi:hypothetical protein